MLIVIDVYIGYMHQSSEVTVDGYHLIHFVTLYLIANCLKTFRIRVNKQYILGGGNSVCFNGNLYAYV